jgi:hypothetical protein
MPPAGVKFTKANLIYASDLIFKKVLKLEEMASAVDRLSSRLKIRCKVAV